MNQNIKLGIAVVAGFAIGFTLAKVISASQNNTIEEVEDKKPKPTKVAKSKTVKESSQKTETFPLRLGSRGNEVERLQVFLMRNLGWVRKPTGIFDLQTEERCKKYFKTDQINKEQYNKLMLDKMIHDQRKNAA